MTAAVRTRTRRRTRPPTEPTGTPDADLCRAVKAGLAARDALIDRHKRLVYDLAHKLNLPPQVQLDDVAQVGLVAMARAAEKFDPDRGVKFCSYVGTAAFNAMRRFIGEQKEVVSRTTSIDIRPDERGDAVRDLIPDHARPDPEVAAEARRRLSRLSGVYRLVVALHFGLDGTPAGWGEIADRTGLTVPQAKRALAVALGRM